jgi:hypothetical protein
MTLALNLSLSAIVFKEIYCCSCIDFQIYSKKFARDFQTGKIFRLFSVFTDAKLVHFSTLVFFSFFSLRVKITIKSNC